MTTATHNPYVPIIQRYIQKDAADAAHYMETMGEDQIVEVLKQLPPSMAAEVLRHMPLGPVTEILQKLPRSYLKDIVDKMEIQQTASAIRTLSQETRVVFLENLSEKKKTADSAAVDVSGRQRGPCDVNPVSIFP